MLNLIIVSIAVVSAIWVYLDATKNKIGKIQGKKGIFNMSAGAWGTVTLLLWIIGFPAYLIKRKSLIEKANENPIESAGRGWKTGLFVIIGGLWLLVTLSSVPMSSLSDFGSSNIAMVKNGSLNNCSGHTVEEMVNGFLTSPSWESGTSDSGTEFVNIKGGITYHDTPVEANIQFVINKNEKTFKFQAFEMNGVPEDNLIAMALLQKMCDSVSQ